MSTLRFDITNSTGAAVSNLAFFNTLPAGLTIASPAIASSGCLGSFSAPAGGSVISLTSGAVAASGSCTIQVDVTGSTAGAYTNTTGDLTSDAGNSGASSAGLTVATNRPGFSKSFSPSSVRFGERSTLTFTIDNTANSSQVFSMRFSDTMPTGMVVASPSNAVSTCSGNVITAVSGSDTITYTPTLPFGGQVAAGAGCTVSVDVLGNAVGVLDNVSGELTSTPGGASQSSGKASASLTVTVERIVLNKSFTNDPVSAGETVDLEFTIRNLERRSSATAITFTDDLEAVLSGLVATGLPLTDPCGAGSSLSGTSVLTLTGGSLGEEESCTFSVTLNVPTGASSGSYTNVTSSISADVGGRPTTGVPATDVLFVTTAPTFTKTFLTETIGGGDTVTLEFTVTNTNSVAGISDIAFSDSIDDFISGTTVSNLPATGFCGSGSIITPVQSIGLSLQVSGANLGPAESCTFSVDLTPPIGTSAGSYLNTTSELTGTIDGAAVMSSAASDTLDVVAGPLLRKNFLDDPVAAGDTVTLEFTLSLDEESPAGASDMTFTDDLDATLSGLVATGLPINDVCGSGSVLSGTSTLTFSGGSLAAGGSCQISVVLQVPATAIPGSYSNTTSNVMATVSGVSVTGGPGQDDLQVAGLSFDMSFVDDPVIAGGDVTLEYTLANTSIGLDATGMFFTHNLNFISGITVSGPPLTDPCGTGSALIASGTFLIFQGGNLTAGTSCTFPITLTIPAGTDSSSYLSDTSLLSATLASNTVIVDSATDFLEVSSDRLALSKEFTDDPVAPGEDVTLMFTVSNLGDDAVTGIAFTDDLDAVATGLASTSGTQADICGAGSAVSGTSTVSFTGGSLAAGGSCSFSVTVNVPTDVSVDSSLINVTSDITGSVGGLSVFGEPATAELEVDRLTFAKSFSGSVEAGSTVDLTFTIQNQSSVSPVRRLAFFDDLDAMLSGTTVVNGVPSIGDCGEESVLAGTSFLTMQGIELLPGGSCSVTVTLLIPSTALGGDYLNTTGDLFLGGISQAAPATATLTVTGLDSDNDGVPDIDDNCPKTANPLQEDADLDGLGDVCDACELDADNDGDGDGVCGDVDNCPADSNPDQGDLDGDGVGDACDVPANTCLGSTDGRGCCVDDFGGEELSEIWNVADIGDATGATATVSGGVLELAGTGSELYHGDDNGAFVHQTVAGDFRMELDITGIPVDNGGLYRKAGLMSRAGLVPDAARVSVHYVSEFPPSSPGGPARTALMFDARDESGAAFALASTVPNVPLPVRVAIQRRGDVWSVLYSNDGGASWVHPTGGAGGETTIAMGTSVLSGPTVTSYDPSQAFTAAFDNLAVCRPEGETGTPTVFECSPEADLDVVMVLDRSGSMGRDHGGSGVSKHDATRDAMVEMLNGLALRSGSSRAALVTLSGGYDAAGNLASGAIIESGFTGPAAIADLLASLSLPVSDPSTSLITSPLAIGIDQVLGMLQAEGDPASAAVVILGSDMVPNIDGMGRGPNAYEEQEVSSIGLTDSFGEFLAPGLVAWLGNFNPMIGTFDGQVVGDTMAAAQMLRDDQGDARIFSLIARGTAANPPVFSEGLADFAAWYTQGAVVGADDPATLRASISGLLTTIDCQEEGPAELSGRIFNDLDGDGVDDAGEPGLAGVDVTAGGSSTVTDAAGGYTLTVPAGVVTVAVDAADLGTVNIPTGDPDGIATPDVATVTVAAWQAVGNLSFAYSAGGGGPIAGCLLDDFEDGVIDPAWSAAFLGNADQGGAVESDGTLKIEGDGTSAYLRTDNGVFVYRSIEGDYRVELDVLGFPTNEGGAYRKAGLMMRSGLGELDARIMVQVIPDFGGTGPVLQFRARTSQGGPGDVAIASNARQIAAPVRIAIEKAGNLYSVQFSTDGGATWVTPAGGNQGSISVDLGSAPLVGMNVVSYDENVTLEAELDNFEACAPEATIKR